MTDLITPAATVLIGDVRSRIAEIPDGSVQCVVTSPPYYGLRDYGHDGQIGLETTPQAYVDEMVAVFREVRRVLTDDGTLWLNIGDSYAAQRGGTHMPAETLGGGTGGHMQNGDKTNRDRHDGYSPTRNATAIGLKHKDLIGIPWRVAFALQDDGWYLRQDIIWSKPNPMPESVKDRCTKSHEYLFLLTKSPRYYYDAEAIAEDGVWNRKNGQHWDRSEGNHLRHAGINDGVNHAGMNRWENDGKRNRRSVWTVATRPYKEAHFAVFPPQLVEPCILAGSREGDTVFDPFAGSGTALEVAQRLGRKALGIELNPEYMPLIRKRLAQQPLVLEVTP